MGNSAIKPTEYDYLFKLLMIGDSDVGKSELLLKFSNDTFSTVTTIGIDFKTKIIEIDGKKIKLQIWDTAGQERFRTITTAYYRGAMGIMLVYDVANEQSFLNLRNWIRNIEKYASHDVQKILIGHRFDDDQMYDENKREIAYHRGQELANEYEIPFMELTSKTNKNVSEAFMCLAEHLYKVRCNINYIINSKTNLSIHNNENDIVFKCNKCNKSISATDWRNGNVQQVDNHAIQCDVFEHNICPDVNNLDVEWNKINKQREQIEIRLKKLAKNDEFKERKQNKNYMDKGQKNEKIIKRENKKWDNDWDKINKRREEIDEQKEEIDKIKEERILRKLTKVNEFEHEDEHKVNKQNDDMLLKSERVKQLKKFLIDIDLEEYFESFRDNDCDISYIEDFDDETLMNDIGINIKFKRKKFLREVNIFKNEMNEFNKIMCDNNVSSIVSKKLKKYGIVTIHILCNEVKEKADLRKLFEINNDFHCDLLWNIIQKQLNPKVSMDKNDDYQNEGIENTPYF